MSIKRFMTPVDYTGELPSNRVTGEYHEFDSTHYKLIVPYGGFFYTHNLFVFDDKMTRLEEGTHYQCVYAHEAVQMRTKGLEVCGAIIIKPNVAGRGVSINYNKVGGEYENYTHAIETALVALDLDGRSVDFANLKNVPEYFIAGPHVEDIGNVYGFEYVKQGLDRLRTSLDKSELTTATQVSGLLNDLIDNINLMFSTHAADSKAHHTTAADVGSYTKDESDRLVADINSDMDSIRDAVREISNGQGDATSQVQTLTTKLNRLSRRLTVVDNIAKNAIQRLGGAVGDGGGVSLDTVKKLISDVTKLFDTYVQKVEVAYTAVRYAQLVQKLPYINAGGTMHIARATEWHAEGSDAEYDIREVVQLNKEMGAMEIFNTGYYNCIDIHQRSDARDKTITGELSVGRAVSIIKALGPAKIYTLLDGKKETAGFIAQDIRRVYPEAVVETTTEDGESRLTVKQSAMLALVQTALFGLL